MAVEKILGAGGDIPIEAIEEIGISEEVIPVDANILQFEDGSA